MEIVLNEGGSRYQNIIIIKEMKKEKKREGAMNESPH